MAMRVNVFNENPATEGRALGLVYEAATLVWAARTGQTASSILAGLTNKQVPPRLVAQMLLKREAIENPQSPAQFMLTLTKKGLDRAVELLARIRSDLNLRAITEAQGFQVILLDKSMPKLKRGGTDKWRFAHDIKLQMFIASYVRHSALGKLMPRNASGEEIEPSSMRTSLEIDRITKKTTEGENIADWIFSAKIPREIGTARIYIEFENSRQNKPAYERRIYWYNTRLRAGAVPVALKVVGATKDIVEAVAKEFGSQEVRRYKYNPGNGNYVLRKDDLGNVLMHKCKQWDDGTISFIYVIMPILRGDLGTPKCKS